MGTTRAALHLACTEGARLHERVVDAGRRLGWSLAGDGGTAGPVRWVAVHHAQGEPCASVVMAGNDRIDDGTLKELALALSQETGMPAIATGIDDSDVFDMILYADGRQIDALGAAAAEPDSSLRRVAPAEREAVWSDIFRRPIGQVSAPPASPFADDALDVLLSHIGVDPAIAHLSFDELAERSKLHGDTRLIAFVQAKPSASAEHGTERGAPPILAPYHDDDDCRAHRVYPAVWPLPPNAPAGLRWLIRSSGTGFDGARITFSVDDVTGGTIRCAKVSIQAYPFFNGQVTSGTPVATYEATDPGTLAEGIWSHEAQSFAMPDLDPEAGKQLLIILRLECVAEAGAAARLRPAFQPLGGDALDLPPVRIVGSHTDWRPIGCDAALAGNTYREGLLRELNTPSVLSLVAMLNGDTEDIRASVRQATEGWLGSLAHASACSASVLTKKHMTASGSITKKRMEFPLPDLVGDPAWKRWFSCKADLQTLRVEVTPQGAFRPCAGLLMQAPLREFSLAGDMAPVEDPALHVVFWTIDHPEAWDAIGTERQAWIDRLEDWIEQRDVLQAYRTGTAAIPLFDDYENFEQTIYEELSGVDWSRRSLKGTLMARSWCGETVRFVAPRMWLGHALMERLSVNASDLGASAEVSPLPGMARIALREGTPIETLERAMSPILPSAR